MPLENLVLGDFSDYYRNEVAGALSYLYSQSRELTTPEDGKGNFTNHLYRAFYDSGRDLELFCRSLPVAEYSSVWAKEQAKRSSLATLQFLGLDVTIRAMAKYAQYFEFSNDEYENLIDNYVGNYCSSNLTIISIKELKKNMMIHFEEDSAFRLPDFSDDLNYPSKIRNLNSQREVKKREFLLTLDLFKSLCSWSNESENLRLLVPLVRNPIVMDFVFRHLDSSQLVWSDREEQIYLEEERSSVKVLCRGLICRRESYESFMNSFPRTRGSTSIRDDLHRLYCQEMEGADFLRVRQEPKILEIIENWSYDQQYLMVSHFISLLTGVPNLFVWAPNIGVLRESLSSHITSAIDNWAYQQIDELDRSILYEESLTIELIQRDLFFNSLEGRHTVEFDINLGEFDRIYERVGKLSVRYSIKVTKALLRWARTAYQDEGRLSEQQKERVEQRLRRVIEPQVEKLHDSFLIPPWEGDLTRIIVNELISQLLLFPNYVINQNYSSDELTEISLVFNYGTFALSYIQHLREVQRQSERNDAINNAINAASPSRIGSFDESYDLPLFTPADRR